VRFHWVAAKSQLTAYTTRLVTHWLTKHGAKEVDAADATVILCTCSSVRELSTLRRARKLADKLRVPLVAGGHAAYAGASLLAWADYVCVGEGYHLLADAAGRGASWRGAFDEAPNVLSKADPLREVVPDYRVPWGRLPAIQLDKHNFYALAGRGCRRKCSFCMTSWVQPWQSEDPRWVRKMQAAAKRSIKGGGGIYFVTNDDGLGTQAGSTTLKRFLAVERDDWPMVIRCGIEGLTAERRRAFKKPIADEDIAAAILKSRRINRVLQLFYIVGFPDDPPDEEAFLPLAECLPTETVRQPWVYLKFTYFEPNPHTPMARWDVSQLRPFEPYVAAAALMRQSGRFRVFKAGHPGKRLWNAIAFRCGPDTIDEWLSARSRVDKMPVADACALAEKIAGRGVVDGTGDFPWTRVRCSVSKRALDPSFAPPRSQWA